MKFGLDDSIIEKLIQVFEDNSKVDKALLFGSRAKGNYRPDSDIDIAIKGYDITIDDIVKMSVAFEENGISNKIDLLDYDSINEKALVEHIDRVGIELYSRWKEYKLGELSTDINYGYTASANDEPIGPKFLRITDIVPQRVNWKTVPFCKINETDLKKNKLEKGDIVIARTGATTGYNYMFNDNIEAAFASYLIRFRINRDLAYPNFINYALKTKGWKGFVEGIMGGSAQPGANAKMFAAFELNLPPISEQITIAAILDSLDDKIDLLQRQNKTLEQLSETLFRQWFEEETNKNWEKVSLFDSIELVGGGTPKTEIANYWNGNIKWISAKDITPNHKGVIVNTEKTITEAGLQNSSARLIPRFSTVISARGTVGKYCLLSDRMAFSQSNYGILPRFKDCYFFSYLLIAYSVEELQAAYGSVFDTITTTTFKEHSIALPKEAEIIKFENGISPYFIKLFSNSNQIHVLTQLRNTLLSKLISGEVRVKVGELTEIEK